MRHPHPSPRSPSAPIWSPLLWPWVPRIWPLGWTTGSGSIPAPTRSRPSASTNRSTLGAWKAWAWTAHTPACRRCLGDDEMGNIEFDVREMGRGGKSKKWSEYDSVWSRQPLPNKLGDSYRWAYHLISSISHTFSLPLSQVPGADWWPRVPAPNWTGGWQDDHFSAQGRWQEHHLRFHCGQLPDLCPLQWSIAVLLPDWWSGSEWVQTRQWHPKVLPESWGNACGSHWYIWHCMALQSHQRWLHPNCRFPGHRGPHLMG